MNKEIKIGDKTYNFVLPTNQAIEDLEKKNDVTRFLDDWFKLVKKQTIKKKGIWTEIPQLPGYKFKNLKVVESPIKVTEDMHQINITFKYDDFEKISFKVKVIKEHNGVPEGTVICVNKELKNHYKGTWASMMGTYEVKVKKEFCEIKK